ncbi:hypothetical protein [Paraburkholderia humisilvae]|uniref:hypothetical protein n=1 Tax=Paraburkholderia humisilvae TaxID=627669 RepID=UPI001581F85A|nr:hypothetical protein [Paraburkholderia humisilvae]
MPDEDSNRSKEERTMHMIDETVRFTTSLAEDSLNPARPRLARHHSGVRWMALLKGCAYTAAAVALLFFTYRLFSH